MTMTGTEEPHQPNDRCCLLFSFFVSPTGVLKILEVLLLAASLTLFLAGKECEAWPVHEVLYGLPLGVCTAATLVTFVVAARLAHQGRNPITVPTWAKGEVLFNVAAVVLLVFAEAITVFDFVCVHHTETVVALSLSLVAILLYVGSGALAWLLYVRHQEHLRALELRRRASRAAMVAANTQLRALSEGQVRASVGDVRAPSVGQVRASEGQVRASMGDFRAPSVGQVRASVGDSRALSVGDVRASSVGHPRTSLGRVRVSVEEVRTSVVETISPN